MKISVLIPIFNVAPYLAACLESVAVAAKRLAEAGGGAPCAALELICIDDGSTDGSAALLQAWFDSHSRDFHPSSKCLHLPNRGVAAARNAGLDQATGDWIAFVDADDILHPDALLDWMRLIRANAAADIVSFGLVDFEDGQPVDWMRPAHPLTSDFCRPFMLSCYRRSLLSGIRFPALRIGEDGVFWGQALDRSAGLATTDVPRYAYRRRSTSATHARWTANKVRDDLVHRLLRAEIVWTSSRPYDRGVHHLIVRGLLCESARQIRQLEAAGREFCRADHRRALARLANESAEPAVCRLLAFLAWCFYSAGALWLFCEFPFRVRDGLTGGWKA